MGDDINLKDKYENWIAQKAQAFRNSSPDFRKHADAAVSAYQRTRDNVDAWAKEHAQNPVTQALVRAENYVQDKAAPVGAWAAKRVEEPATDMGEVHQMQPVDVEGQEQPAPKANGGLLGTSPVDKPVPQTQAIGVGQKTPDWLNKYMAGQ